MQSRFIQPLFVGFLLLLGGGLRFHALDRQSLWDDEMSTLRTIATPVRGILHRFASYEAHPPLYFLQLRVWRAMGLGSLVKLRSNSALWGTLSLFLAYWVGRRYGGEPMGILTVALLAFSPFHLAYSQELRPYAMAMALSLAALWTLERKSWVPLGFLWAALLYTHYWGAFVVAAQTIYGCTIAASPAERKKVLIAFSAADAAFVLWLPVLVTQLRMINQLVFWVPAFSVANLGKVYLAYTGLIFNFASGTFYLPARVWTLIALGLFFALALVRGFRLGPRAAVLWLTIGLAVPWLLSLWKPSIFVWYRYPVLMLPAFALLVAAGVLRPRSNVQGPRSKVRLATQLASAGGVALWTLDLGLRTLLVFVCLGSYAWGDWVYFHQWQKANPKAVVQYVHWLREPNSIVVRPAYFADLFNFYDRGTTLTMDEHVFDSPEKRAALKGRDVILLAFEVPSDPIADALLSEFKPLTGRYFPGTAHLGVTVYRLK